jgi:FtsP/CotA-like multicopper oxidase with cupredoxin domain
MWHGHTGADRADGLGGPLIVRPRPGDQPVPGPLDCDAERTLLLQDWWHTGAVRVVAAATLHPRLPLLPLPLPLLLRLHSATSIAMVLAY